MHRRFRVCAALLAPLFVLVLGACGATSAAPDTEDFDASIDGGADATARDSGVDAGPRDSGLDATRDAATDAGGNADADANTNADSGAPDAGEDVCAPCTWSGASSVGVVSAGAELSGLAASAVRPGVLYAHNDSGDTARFFALQSDGSTLAEYTVTGATNVDWEDVAVAPCGTDRAGSCVFLADIGDNLKARTSVTIYRVPEPLGASGSVAATAIEFTYPDGAHDAEALFVDGAGALHVVTKETSGASTVFSLGIPNGAATVVATRVGKLPAFNFGFDLPSRVTAADFYPSTRCPRLVVRTYGSVELLTGQPGDTVAMLIARGAKTLPRILSEQQGESVAFSRGGRELYTISEGANAELHRMECR